MFQNSSKEMVVEKSVSNLRNIWRKVVGGGGGGEKGVARKRELG